MQDWTTSVNPVMMEEAQTLKILHKLKYKFDVKLLFSTQGHKILDAGYLMLDAGYWILVS